MKAKKCIVLCVLTMTYFVSYSQLRYPIIGTYMKKSAQGMAIYEDSAFLMSDGGQCRVLDLQKGVITRTFIIGSAAKSNHANTACFRKKALNYKYKIPLLYLSECTGKGRCFIEQFTHNSSILLQTIEMFENGKNLRVANWTLDNDNNCMYAIVRNREELLDSAWNVRCRIFKFRIPELNEGIYVRFNEKDVIDQFDVIFPNVMQGVKIRGKYMYLVTGQSQSFYERKDGKREIYVIDLRKKRIIKSIDLTYVSTNEPEDIDFYNNKCLLYCGHEGGIYEVKLK